jgi:outer membrane protein TolC
MKKFFLSFFVLLVCVIGAAGAQDLTWNDVLSEARQKNPTLKKAAETLRQAQLSYYSAYSGFLPQLSANASAGQSESDASGFSRSYSYGLSGSISLFSGFSDLASVWSQEANLKMSEASYSRTYADTVYDLKSAFINLLGAQESVVLLEDILQKRTQNYELVMLQYNSGTQDKGSLLNVEADKVSAQFNLEKAQRYLKLSSLQLAKTIGRDDFDAITATGTFSYDSSLLGTDVSGYAEKTPEYRIAFYSLEKSKADELSGQSGLYPSLNLSGSTSKTGPEWAPDSNSWNLGLNMSYSFFTGGKNIYNAKIARSGRIAAEDNLVSVRQQLESSVSVAFNSFLDAAGSVSVSEKYMKAYEEQSNIITTQYINGLQTYYNWYSVENSYISSLTALLNAKQSALLKEAAFKKTIGLGE